MPVKCTAVFKKAGSIKKPNVTIVGGSKQLFDFIRVFFLVVGGILLLVDRMSQIVLQDLKLKGDVK